MSKVTYSGNENRPASAQEIAKLPGYVCDVCRLQGVAAIVAPDPERPGRGRCRNATACTKRAKKAQREKAR